jgi:hypothetical protein
MIMEIILVAAFPPMITVLMLMLERLEQDLGRVNRPPAPDPDRPAVRGDAEPELRARFISKQGGAGGEYQPSPFWRTSRHRSFSR